MPPSELDVRVEEQDELPGGAPIRLIHCDGKPEVVGIANECDVPIAGLERRSSRRVSRCQDDDLTRGGDRPRWQRVEAGENRLPCVPIDDEDRDGGRGVIAGCPKVGSRAIEAVESPKGGPSIPMSVRRARRAARSALGASATPRRCAKGIAHPERASIEDTRAIPRVLASELHT